MKKLIDMLYSGYPLSKDQWIQLIRCDHENDKYLFELARKKQFEIYKKLVFIRGLIEISNYCKNDCLYCGIRRSNSLALRYRLNEDEILNSAKTAHELGFRTFVMQGGEDPYFSDAVMCSIIRKLKERFPDSAVTLSLGEKSRASFKLLREAGADRYLLRHETACAGHYKKIHPPEMRYENRRRCLYDLKELGYQTGSGFMVGSPFQTEENLADDMLFLTELQPEMVGIGPFIPHKDTPFGKYPAGSTKLTLRMIALTRLALPRSLIPSTTALGTSDPNGREKGILAGANVVMPNVSPQDARGKYMLYNNKISDGAEAAEGLESLRKRISSIGYEIEIGRGDFIK